MVGDNLSGCYATHHGHACMHTYTHTHTSTSLLSCNCPFPHILTTDTKPFLDNCCLAQNLLFQLFFTVGDQVLVEKSLQNGSEVFRVGGGKSVLLGSNSDHSFLLIPHSGEGTEMKDHQ